MARGLEPRGSLYREGRPFALVLTASTCPVRGPALQATPSIVCQRPRYLQGKPPNKQQSPSHAAATEKDPLVHFLGGAKWSQEGAVPGDSQNAMGEVQWEAAHPSMRLAP